MNGKSVLAAVLALGACSMPAEEPAPTSRPTPSTAASVPPSSLTTTATPLQRGAVGLATTDRLERQHRLAQALPHSTPHYRIDFSVGADGRLRLVITLLGVLNDSGDLASYQAQLRRSKAEAVAFIAAQGDGPSTYTVTYLPPEAAAL